jgi:hypothetical protein
MHGMRWRCWGFARTAGNKATFLILYRRYPNGVYYHWEDTTGTAVLIFGDGVNMGLIAFEDYVLLTE